MGRSVGMILRFVTGIGLVVCGAIGFVVHAEPAAACSCMAASDAAAFDGSAAVFTATSADRREPSRGRTWSSTDPVRIVFDVDRVYKGRVHATQSIVTAMSGASCGMELYGSGPYLVFAYQDPTDDGILDGEFASSLCSGNRTVTAADPVPASFGVGRPPLAGASPIGGKSSSFPGLSPDSSPWRWVAVGGGVVVVALGALVIVRRRRHRSVAR